MAPKSLTEKETEEKRKHILKKGMELMFSQGIKKTSVDEIISAAEIAKGTFYLYFKSKDDFFKQLFFDFFNGYMDAVRNLIMSSTGENLKIKLKNFISGLFNLPEFIFFFSNHEELEVYMEILNSEHSDFRSTEYHSFENLLKMAGIDTSIVNPAVVHNYLHALFIMANDKMMLKDHIKETFEVMSDGLVDYIFKGEIK